MFLQQQIKSGPSFTQLLCLGTETTGLTAQLPRETMDCSVALDLCRRVAPRKQAGHVLAVFPVFPSWGGTCALPDAHRAAF